MIQGRIPLIVILIFFVGIIKLKGQQNPVIPPSPEAIALAKYINYPVDYSTGLPDISIPLYEITAGTLKLPISLKYHAGGIKISEPTGWIGTGWSLSAEPQISRSVNVKADEAGYLLNNNLGNANNTQYYYRQVAQGVYEEEPDEFFYSLLSKSGRFFYYKPSNTSNQYSIKTLPYEPIRITNVNESLFSVIDDNGTLYNFGKSIGGTFCTETTSNAGSGFSPVITTWKVAEIISTSKRDTISFKYGGSVNETVLSNSPDKIIVEDSSSYPYYNTTYVQPGYLVPLLQRPVPVLQSVNRSVDAYQVGTNGLELEPDYAYLDHEPEAYVVGSRKVQEITFSGGKVVFEVAGLILDNIKVYNKNNELLRQIKLHSSLVGTDPATRRLWLDSVVISGSSVDKTEKYGFAYKNQQLPYYTSKQIDYWGYFNNSQNDFNQVLIEPQTMKVTSRSNATGFSKNISLGAANRMPNEASLMVGMIDKISWPTGGYTKYEFEINKYKSESGVIKNGGGARIKSIKAYDAGNKLEKSLLYKYGADEDGSGIARTEPKIEDFMYEQTATYYEPILLEYNSLTVAWSYEKQLNLLITRRKRTMVASSLQNLFYSQGAPVVYSEVAEYETDSTKTNGKTVYTYNNSRLNNCVGCKVPGTTIVSDYKNSWSWGELASKNVYRTNPAGNGFEKVYTERNIYETYYTGEKIFVGKTYNQRDMQVSQNSFFPSYINDDVFWVNYHIQIGKRILKKKEVVEYR